MIDKTIKNIKKILCKVLEGLLTAKISTKKKKRNTLQGFRGDTYSKNSKYKIFIYLFIFCISYI